MAKVKGESEHTIQSRLIDYLKFALRPELEVIAIPNGGLRKKRVAIALKQEGLRPGAPDLIIALPAGRVAWLEMKTPIGRLSTEQKDFRDRILALGHYWGMARSVQEALILLTQWDALRPEFRVYTNDNQTVEEKYERNRPSNLVARQLEKDSRGQARRVHQPSSRVDPVRPAQPVERKRVRF